MFSSRSLENPCSYKSNSCFSWKPCFPNLLTRVFSSGNHVLTTLGMFWVLAEEPTRKRGLINDVNSMARYLLVNLAFSGLAGISDTFRYEVEDWEELGPSPETSRWDLSPGMGLDERKDPPMTKIPLYFGKSTFPTFSLIAGPIFHVFGTKMRPFESSRSEFSYGLIKILQFPYKIEKIKTNL